MRLLLVVLALGPSWTGTWSNDVTGTSGAAVLSGETLRLDGAALGCAQPVVLPVRVHGKHVDGSGRDVRCNHGLRWAVSGTTEAAIVKIRLADGSAAALTLALKRR
jgi:hypothetical protein